MSFNNVGHLITLYLQPFLCVPFQRLKQVIPFQKPSYEGYAAEGHPCLPSNSTYSNNNMASRRNGEVGRKIELLVLDFRSVIRK